MLGAGKAGRFAVWLAAALSLVVGLTGAARAELLVFAAASLSDVLTAVSDRFSAESGVEVSLSFGSSSTLARQIAAGAPAEVFISAHADWVDFVAASAGYGETARLFSNQLVIIAPGGEGAAVGLEGLPDALGAGRLALGDPDHVPAGIYAKEALEAAGVWTAIENRIAPAEDARAASRLVERGAAPFGIVYATDALAGNVEIVGRIDGALHTLIGYFIALAPTAGPDADAFRAYLQSGRADDVIASYGFVPLEAGDE